MNPGIRDTGDFDVDQLLGMTLEVKTLMAGLPPPTYQACYTLIAEFVMAFLEMQITGCVSYLDSSSEKDLREFSMSTNLGSVKVVGENFYIIVRRQRAIPPLVVEMLAILS